VSPISDDHDHGHSHGGDGGLVFHDGRHPSADVEEWVFAAWTDDAALGVISGHRLLGRNAWYWAALARHGRPLLHITDFDVPVRLADPFIVKGEAMWAEHTREAPMEQWTVGNETYAAALDDPEEALGRGYGNPTPIAFDLEWYATGAAVALELAPDMSIGYQQRGVVHGAIEILGEPKVELSEVRAQRWHRWTSGPAPDGSLACLGPLPLPDVVAHTGVRAPFRFPDGSTSDLVLTSTGWCQRASRPSAPSR
jgi:hypothetical protein